MGLGIPKFCSILGRNQVFALSRIFLRFLSLSIPFAYAANKGVLVGTVLMLGKGHFVSGDVIETDNRQNVSPRDRYWPHSVSIIGEPWPVSAGLLLVLLS